MGLLALPLVFLAGCFATPGPEPTSSPASSRAASTPSPAPEAQPEQPFDGDCGLVLSSDAAKTVFDGHTATLNMTDSLTSVMPDVPASTELVGGVTCAWAAESIPGAHLGVFVVPVADVPADILETRTEFACHGWGVCGRGEVHSGMWVFAETTGPVYEDPTAEQLAALERTVDAAIGSVTGQPAEVLAGVAVPPGPDWWTLSSCGDIESVAAVAGMTSPEPGFPSDNFPEGPLWEYLTGAGAVTWCPWYESSTGAVLSTEVYVQPGIGAPSASQLEAAGAEPITISGADAAYRISDGGGHVRSVKVLAVVGPNRITVGGDEPEAVAAAAISVLAG